VAEASTRPGRHVTAGSSDLSQWRWALVQRGPSPTLASRTVPADGAMTTLSTDRPLLDVLVCGAAAIRSAPLRRLLATHHLVRAVQAAGDLAEAKRALAQGAISIVFLGFERRRYETCDFIFSIRRKRPEVVFVLCVADDALARDGDFYLGERSRLLHYYRLDPATPPDALPYALEQTLAACLMDLGRSES
jgi:hypothetical protein